ncbi:MAG: hypothetical protein FWB85_04285 [Chitinispirillia bacterium]|nr:hypothetical protein [Chitinispirillia bacterium]MCL2241559.1 hypothetical protein [Chitinispirillia bacterium]
MIQFTDKIEPVKIMGLLAKGLPYYLESWQDVDDDRGLFGTVDPKTFNMRTVGSSSPVIEYVLRPHLNVLCVLSAYVYHGQLGLIEPIISKAGLVDKLKRGLAWACSTHVTGSLDVKEFLKRERWGENWRSSLWATLLGVVSVLAESVLGEEEQIRIREIIAHEANRFTGVTPPSGCHVDSKAEENAQDAMLLAWAINLCPHHPSAAAWEESLKVWAVNIDSNVLDGADHSRYFGRSVADTVTTCNIYPDFTAENHGFFTPDALTYGMWVVLGMSAYKLQRRDPPAYLSRKNCERTFDILIRFCLPNGMLFAPGGHDMPLFTPHPLALAWGYWNCDPRASHIIGKLLSWMDASLESGKTPWVIGFEPSHDGWELFFQSQVGAELALLACLPFTKEYRSYTAGQVENAIDTRQIYPYVEICYRRNVRTTRSVAWKAIGGHPMAGLNLHSSPELIAPFKAALLGMPSVSDPVKSAEVLFHNDGTHRDGFDTYGRIVYFGASGRRVLTRDVRIITCTEEGLIVFDKITADVDLQVNEHYLSPLYIVNDHWTSGNIDVVSGPLKEAVSFEQRQFREITCPLPWANVNNQLLYQYIWGRTKGLCYLPGGERNAPPYWKNCRLDMLATRVDPADVKAGDTVYSNGFYVGGGKGPRLLFKTVGNPGEFFKGVVVMDGRNNIELD